MLEQYGVKMIGASKDAIDKAEDRQKFKEAMTKIGLGSARSGIAHSMDEALKVLDEMGYPCVIRPSFTMGGSGGGIATTGKSSSPFANGAWNCPPPASC